MSRREDEILDDIYLASLLRKRRDWEVGVSLQNEYRAYLVLCGIMVAATLVGIGLVMR